jgi:hypothetical protein
MPAEAERCPNPQKAAQAVCNAWLCIASCINFCKAQMQLEDSVLMVKLWLSFTLARLTRYKQAGKDADRLVHILGGQANTSMMF